MSLLTDAQIALAHDLEAIREALAQGFVLPPRPAPNDPECDDPDPITPAPGISEAPKDRKTEAREKIAEIVKPPYTPPNFDP